MASISGGGAFLHAFRIAVAPDVIGHEVAVAVVDEVADGLADAVVAEDRRFEFVPAKHLEFRRGVVALAEGTRDLEMVAEAGEVEAVVPELGGLGREFFERQVGPGAGEQEDGSGHGSGVP